MPKYQTQADAMLALSEGLITAAHSPNIKKYRPHTKQAIFHRSPKKKKLYIGGNRSGKTTGGVCEDIWRATCTHPFRPELNKIGPNRGRVIGVDFVNGVETILFPQFKQWLYPSALRGGSWESAYDKTLRTLFFSNGSTIEFKSYDQDLDKHAGTSRHWIHFDEEPPKSIYVENMARIIDTNGDFWITMTPVEGMTWVHEDLYENNVDNPEGAVEVIEVHMQENPFLSEEAIKSFIDGVDEDEVTARLEGKFVQVGGRIYKQFDPVVGGPHVLKAPIEKPRQVFKDWLWICSLDHGLNNPTAALWHAVNNNGKIITFFEHYKNEWSIKQHAEEIWRIIREEMNGREPDIWVADPSIMRRDAVAMTSIHEEYLKYNIPWTLGNNDVKAGIIRVKKYLAPSKADKGLPRWQVTPNCEMLIKEMKKYRWKTYANKKQRYENNVFEEPHKKDDHACDSLRYAIMSRPDLFADAESDLTKINNAMANIENFDISKAASAHGTRSDPWGLTEHPAWREGNSIPNEYSDAWKYDEDLGGLM